MRTIPVGACGWRGLGGQAYCSSGSARALRARKCASLPWNQPAHLRDRIRRQGLRGRRLRRWRSLRSRRSPRSGWRCWGLAVRVALLPRQLTQGAAAILWGLFFALFLWGGGRGARRLRDPRDPLRCLRRAACALFIYLRGKGLESPARRSTWRHPAPADHPPARTGEPRALSPHAVAAAEQKRWLTWFGLPALIAAILLGITFGTGQMWILGVAVGAIIVDIGVLIWLTLSSDTNGGDESMARHH